MEIINLTKDHVSKVYSLEKKCYGDEFFTTSDIKGFVTDFAKNGLIVIDDNFVVGYILFLTDDGHDIEFRLGVHEQYRRMGHGTRLLNRVKVKINERKPLLRCWVPESNLAGQLFLQSQGFICSKTECKHYKRKNTNGYMFVYRLEWSYQEQNGILVPEELSLDGI